MHRTKRHILTQLEAIGVENSSNTTRCEVSAYLNYHNLIKCLHYLKKSSLSIDSIPYLAQAVIVMIKREFIQIKSGTVQQIRSRIELLSTESRRITLELPANFSKLLQRCPLYVLSQIVQSLYCIEQYLTYYLSLHNLQDFYNRNGKTCVYSLEKQIQFLGNSCNQVPSYSIFIKIMELKETKRYWEHTLAY